MKLFQEKYFIFVAVFFFWSLIGKSETLRTEIKFTDIPTNATLFIDGKDSASLAVRIGNERSLVSNLDSATRTYTQWAVVRFYEKSGTLIDLRTEVQVHPGETLTVPYSNFKPYSPSEKKQSNYRPNYSFRTQVNKS